ncbi:decarboxylase [Candidatus Pacearchaeota archaeon]|nr:decarboxylase [Candidatus Pacearchaeota archaeon]
MDAKFILSKKILKEQVERLEKLGLKISYSYKTNRIVGEVLQDISDVDFSIHAKEEIEDIKNKSKIWFFTQAELEEELKEILGLGIRNFVVDNEIDLQRLLNVVENAPSYKDDLQGKRPQAYPEKSSTTPKVYPERKNFSTKGKIFTRGINLSLRMKFREHRIGTGKYFVYGMSSVKINEIISRIKDNKFIDELGVHIHRKSQNTSEWEIVEDLKDSLTEESLERINFINLGGGLPSIYRSSNVDVFNYIFEKLKNAKKWLAEKNIKTIIEPGRFLSAPCIKLVVEIIQKYDNNLVVNTTIYNCALDNVLTNTKMLVEGEKSKDEEGEEFLIKGNSPTRDDIFRYRVKLENPKIGEKIIFLNAGAYNYTTDFFGYKKLNTEIV